MSYVVYDLKKNCYVSFSRGKGYFYKSVDHATEFDVEASAVRVLNSAIGIDRSNCYVLKVREEKGKMKKSNKVWIVVREDGNTPSNFRIHKSFTSADNEAQRLTRKTSQTFYVMESTVKTSPEITVDVNREVL